MAWVPSAALPIFRQLMHDTSQRYASSQHVLYVARTSTQLHLSAHFQPTSPPVYPPTCLPSRALPSFAGPPQARLARLRRVSPPRSIPPSEFLNILACVGFTQPSCPLFFHPMHDTSQRYVSPQSAVLPDRFRSSPRRPLPARPSLPRSLFFHPPCTMPLKGMYHCNPLCHATVSVPFVAHACGRHVFRPVPRLLLAHHPNSSISRPTCSCLRLPSYDTYQRYASFVYQPTKSPFRGFLATCLDAAPAPSPREDRR